ARRTPQSSPRTPTMERTSPPPFGEKMFTRPNFTPKKVRPSACSCSEISLNWPRVETLRGNDRQIESFFLSLPPIASLILLAKVCEMILIDARPQIFRGRFRKRISAQQLKHLRTSLEKAFAEFQKPRIAPVRAKRGKPHLPIQPRLMRLHK